MKKIFTLICAFGMVAGANAQYCGQSNPSGPSQCNVVPLEKSGLVPISDSLPSLINGVDVQQTIAFKNYDTTRLGATLLNITELTIDEINNLPAGLCWSTNKADNPATADKNETNTYAKLEEGCIRIHGTTCATPGAYKLEINVLVDIEGIGEDIPYSAEAVGLKYIVRVKNSGDADVAVDTSQDEPFRAYGQGIVGCEVGINDLASVNSLSIVPNPFTNSAVVTFVSEKTGVMTERITNMLGAVVSKNAINVKAGENSSVINGTNLNAGVYFYSLTDGKNTTTRRVVISE